MKKLYTLMFSIALAYSTNAQSIITQWTFDDSTTNPSTGVGTIGYVGSATAPTDTAGAFPAGNPSTGKSFNSTTYPEQGTLSGTSGFEIAVSTLNYGDITLSFDPRGSNTGSRWQEYQYSIDGTSWTTIGNNGGTTLTNGWLPQPVLVTLPANAADKENLKIRLVSIFAPETTAYTAIGASSNYGAGGTWRVDNVIVSGSALSVKDNAIAGLQVYPNPVTNGTLYINTLANAEKTVQIFDVVGKNVLNTVTAGETVNVSSLNSGVYIVKITEQGNTASRKLVIK
jgi:hypothetical protein